MRSALPAVIAMSIAATPPRLISFASVVALVGAFSVTADAADSAQLTQSMLAFVAAPSVGAAGERTAVMHLLAHDVGGTPMTNLSAKFTLSSGKVLGFTEVSAGRYAVEIELPKVTSPTQITVSAKGRAPGRKPVSATGTLDLDPPMAGDVSVSLNPVDGVVGQVLDATLSLSTDPLAGAPLVRVNDKAEVLNPVDMGNGRTTARYQVAKVNYPHLGIVTVVDPTDPAARFGWSMIRMNGSVAYPVQSAPSAAVVLRVAGREFGPVTTDASGKASVPVQVPPGVSEGTLVTIQNGQSKEEPLDLRVPETRRLQWFPAAPTLPGDPSAPVTLRVLVLTPSGEPDLAAKLSVKASAGVVSAATHEGGGVYRVAFTPAAVAGSVELIASLDGAAEVQRDTLAVSVVEAPATDVQLGRQGAEVRVATRSAAGQAVGGAVWLAPERGAPVISAAPTEPGVHAVKLAEDVGEIIAVSPGLVSTNPGWQVVLAPVRGGVDADGESVVPVVVAVLDRFGAPVANQDVALSVDGGGSLPDVVRTDAAGLAVVRYTAAADAGIAQLRGQSGMAQGTAAVLRFAGAGAFSPLPLSGSPEQVASQSSFARRIATLAAGEGGVTVAAAPPPSEVSDVPTAATEQPGVGSPEDAIIAFDLVLTPNPVGPGGVVLVEIQTFSPEGLAVPGKSIDVLTTAGTLGPVTEPSPGRYQTRLSVPADASGEVKLSAVAPGGTTQLAKVIVEAGAPLGGDAVADSPAVMHPPARPPRVAGDTPWFRARAQGVVSTYRYSQRPGEEPGPLLPSTLSMGGQGSGGPATPLGFEVDARAWLPAVPYVGARASYRGSSYSMLVPGFGRPVDDWLNNVQVELLGRYPFDVGADRFWVGARAGLHSSNAQLFQGCIEQGCQVEVSSIPFHALGLGGEIGAEFGQLFFTGAYVHGFLRGTVPFSQAVDIDLGYDVTQDVSVNIGFSSLSRKVSIQGSESGTIFGEVQDSQLIFKLGMGFALR